MDGMVISPYGNASSSYWVNNAQRYTIQQQQEPSLEDLLTDFAHG